MSNSMTTKRTARMIARPMDLDADVVSALTARRVVLATATAALAVAFVFALVLTVIAAPASAATIHSVSSSFGIPTGDGTLALASTSGVAVNGTSHDVYVADTGHARVIQATAAGSFVRAFGADVGGAGVDSCTVNCAAGTPGSAAGAFTTPTFLAIDNSGGPSGGDVYVADTTSNTVQKFSATGTLISTWGFGGLLDGSTATDGPFTGLAGIAVDPAGQLWVYDDAGEMFAFAQDGTFVTDWQSGRGVTVGGIAVDANTNLYVATGAVGVTQFTPGGTQVGDLDDTYTTITGLAADLTTNDLYVDDGGAIRHYAPSCDPSIGCAPADSDGAGDLSAPAGLAVDPTTGTLFVADGGTENVVVLTPVTVPDVTTDAASSVGPTSGTLNGTVNPNGTTVTDCHFAYVDDADYAPAATDPYAAGATVPCASTPSGSTVTAVSAIATGLTPNTTYHVRLLAANANGTQPGLDQTLITPGPPIVAGERVQRVGATTATVGAQITPKGDDTTIYVQFGPTSSYGSRTADVAAGASHDAQAVTVDLGGLSRGTTYHFRFVATNAEGTTVGLDQTLTTPSPAPAQICPNAAARHGAGALLPDCRAYEQATPVDKGGAGLVDFQGFSQASPSGDAITFLQDSGISGAASEQSFPVFVSRRVGGAWATKGGMPARGAGVYQNVLGWTPDLSEVINSVNQAGPDSAFLTHRVADQTDHTVVDYGHGVGSYAYAGSTADGTTLLFERSYTPLTANAAAGVNNVYATNRATGALTLVSVLPDGTAPSQGAFVGPYDWNRGDTTQGGASVVSGGYLVQDEHAMSADGSRIVFTAAGTGQLYLRENPFSAGASTAHVSASQKTNGSGPGGTDPNGPQPAAFLGATTDGSAIFFSSCEQLTNDATATSPSPSSGCAQPGGAIQPLPGTGADLYRYDVASGRLTDLTVDANGGDPLGAGVRGLLGMSADGRYVYFAADGALAPGAGASTNVYVWHDGQVRFVTNTPYFYNWQSYPGAQTSRKLPTARVSADGRVLLLAGSSLTSEDTGGFTELYRYTADDGRLGCISCNQSGVPVAGNADVEINYDDDDHPTPLAPASFMPRNLSASGDRIFFDSADALLPQDVNGVEDVYEWEADGAGSCHGTGQHGGCLALLSTGTSPDPSYLGDVSANGDDAFIYTSQPLVSQDGDDAYDIYDASTDGGLAGQSPAPVTPCASADVCHPGAGPGAPAPTAASVTFPGLANGTGTKAVTKVKVARTSVKGRSVSISVTVPGVGLLTATGKDIKSLRRTATRAGTYKLTVTLTIKARASLKHHHKLRLALRVGYTTAAGQRSSAAVTVTVKA
jgi:hypothetical protein